MWKVGCSYQSGSDFLPEAEVDLGTTVVAGVVLVGFRALDCLEEMDRCPLLANEGSSSSVLSDSSDVSSSSPSSQFPSLILLAPPMRAGAAVDLEVVVVVAFLEGGRKDMELSPAEVERSNESMVSSKRRESSTARGVAFCLEDLGRGDGVDSCTVLGTADDDVLATSLSLPVASSSSSSDASKSEDDNEDDFTADLPLIVVFIVVVVGVGLVLTGDADRAAAAADVNCAT